MFKSRASHCKILKQIVVTTVAEFNYITIMMKMLCDAVFACTITKERIFWRGLFLVLVNKYHHCMLSCPRLSCTRGAAVVQRSSWKSWKMKNRCKNRGQKREQLSRLHSAVNYSFVERCTRWLLWLTSEVICLSSMLPGRRHRNKKKVPGVTVVSLETCDTEKQIPPNLGKFRD